MELIISFIFLFCIAFTIGLGVDLLKEDRDFLFGLSIATAVYFTILLVKLIIM